MSATCLEPTGVERPVPADRGGGATRPRWATFDLARLLAAYAIVWVHASRLPALQSSKALGRFAVPFFVFGAVFFVIDGLRRRPWRGFAEYARSRFVRIYLPFLAWSVVYLGLKLVKAALLPEQPNDMPGWSLFWAGSFYHLWFMPFILVVSLAAFGLGKAVLGRPRAEAALAAGCAVAGLAVALAPTSAFGFPSTGRGAALAAAVPAASAWADDWPAYRKDAARTGVTAESLPLPLLQRWVWRPSQPPRPAWPEPGKELNRTDFDYAYQPVVAGGLVYFGSSADDTVRALDAATGEPVWRFTTEGPVRFAPTIARGKAYVASDDGFLYCLDAKTGKLVWRFRAGPSRDRLIGSGRLIARDPCRSGAAVVDDVVYVTAGMWPTEGVYVYALDADTGKEWWSNDSSGNIYIDLPQSTSPKGAQYTSPGQRPGAAWATRRQALKGRHRRISPFQGSPCTAPTPFQGVALGFDRTPFQGEQCAL